MSTALSERQPRTHLYTYPVKSLWLIALCFIFSGATGLIYEVLWARMLGLVFGATTFAISAVLAAFMGGLALGSALAGRLAARIRRPLLAYGLIEVGIALYALAVPLLFGLVNRFYALVWEQLHPGFYAFSLWRFVLSCAVLLVPTTLMGATLPVLAAALLRRSPAHTSASVARLYTCNLAGAILGTIAAGFLLLPALGVSGTIYTAALINIVVGFCALVIDSRYGRELATKGVVAGVVAGGTLDADANAVDADESPRGSEREESQRLLASVESGDAKFWLLCAAVSGFVTISAQVAWTRVLTMIIGSSTYAFSITVALFLLGLSGGAYLVARRKINEDLRRVIMKVELATAVSLFLSLMVINLAPAMLFYLGFRFELESWSGLLALQVFVAGLLVLLPAWLMGMVMPLVLVWASEKGGGDASVRWVGRSYALNTLGAIAGAFITGFILIPKAGTRITILFAAALSVIIAGLAYRPAAGVAGKRLRRALATGAAAVLIAMLFISAPRLRLNELTKGGYDTLVRVIARTRSIGAANQAQAGVPQTERILMYEEGPTATVSVRKDGEITTLAINGRTNASDKEDMPTQVMLGQLPLLLSPRIENGLIVGYGSGVTVGAMLQSPIKSLACVELEPSVINAGEYFNHVNNQPRKDARLRLIVDDARAYLRVNPERYDLIVSEPSHPWVPGVANLFTREFFELGRSRLSDDGVFMQWLQIYQLSNDGLRSVLATYQSVFPHVLVFRVGGAARGKDLLLVGSRAPLTLERIEERMAEPLSARELARVNIRGRSDIESWYVCDETQLGRALEGAIINTDDNMHIENRAPREAFLPLMDVNAAWIEGLAAKARLAHALAGL
ncbi:MAG TPA: fused MFS/spermidine synthase [Pyrinomonadaceae bacterium]|jgi:spermidine synthase|nr:fused MFS/spermidine synthase [Pyrinomonadaceae bacterium]